MSEKWDDATRRYQQAQNNYRGVSSEGKNRVIQEIEEFMQGEEGHSAMALLEASHKRVVLCEYQSDTLSIQPTVEMCFMNGKGLRCATIADRGRMVCDPQGKPAEVCFLVYEVARTKNPNEILPMLRKELDIIADEAPEL